MQTLNETTETTGKVEQFAPEVSANRSGRLNRIRCWQMPLRWYRRLTLANALAIWGLIVLGGLVRVSGSGTGCGESWPLCKGHWFPGLDYHELIEWNHRLFAVLVGWLLAATVISTLLWYRRPRRLLVLGLLAPLSYLAQAVLGAITVILHLDHTWVAAHMGNSMLLLAWVTLLAMFARVGAVGLLETNGWLKGAALATLVWTFVALFTGSAVIGAGADLACPSWPQCDGSQLLPVEAGAWVNFGHRLAVGLSDVLLLVLSVMVWRTRRQDRRLMRCMHVLAVLYIGQVFLGAFTIWLGAPAELKGAHLALAAATWAILVVMVTFIWVGPPVKSAGGTDAGARESRPRPRRKLTAAVRAKEPAWLQNYLGLMRLKVIPLLLIPTGASMLIAAAQPQRPATPDLLPLMFWTMLGGTLSTGGAHALNQYLDRDLDARMRRTRRRAVVTGLISPRRALAFGVILTAVSFGQLVLTVNWLTAALSLAGNFFYVFIYTLWLKRITAQNIVIGGAAGAVPPLVGWAAVTGRLDLPALLFFAIIFFWTPAHFWALALVRHEDYEAAGIPMLPVVRGDAYTRRSILWYAALLVVITLLPFAVRALGWVYLAAALALGGLLIRYAVRLERSGTNVLAWKLFKFSNTYLALLYVVMVVDRLMVLV